MARRRTRPAPRRKEPGGYLAWLLVLLVAGGIGWIWWRAAYGANARIDLWSLASSWWTSPASIVEDELTDDEPAPGRSDVGGGGRAPEAEAEAASPISNPAPLIAPVAGPGGAEGLVSNPVVGVTVSTQAMAGENIVRVESAGPRDSTNILAVQMALARRGISSGPIDGVAGSQTRAALRVFQKNEGLPATGDADDRTVGRLGLSGPILTNYVVTAEDVRRLTWVPSTWLGKASRERLDYETILELVAEKCHAHPRLVRQLNPRVDWTRVAAGTRLAVPAMSLPPLRGRAGFVRISLSEKALRVFDSSSNLVAHFPCSIARKAEKRPVGELRVIRLAEDPNYRFDPKIFRESPEAQRIGRKLMIPPGPNNPVGTAWIGLSRPGYGIHGTPNPEDVGRTESHGCFRLANWNAEFLVKAAWVGMAVIVDP